MKGVKTLPLAGIIVGVMLGGIAISMATGTWKTTSTKEPVKYSQGEFAGQANPADIRGSYTWQDIENNFGLPVSVGAFAFSTPEHPLSEDERINVLEELYAGTLPAGLEIGTDSVRVFVALYKGLPYEAEEGTVLPARAIEELRKVPGIDVSVLMSFALALPEKASATAESSPLGAPSGGASGNAVPSDAKQTATISGETHEAPDYTLTGKTTFGELYGWGLTEPAVEAAIGFKPGARSQSVRDAATAAGASFSELKAKLQDLLDELKP